MNTTVETEEITLTADQQKAYDDFFTFYHDPDQHIFVIKGGAGCGKSTLLKEIWKGIQSHNILYESLGLEAKYDVAFTATNNKAADNLSYILSEPVYTIQSFIGARVDFEKGLVLNKRNPKYYNQTLIFIDEAGTMDKVLETYLTMTINSKTCKVVYIGDPDQLLPVKSSYQPAFKPGPPTVSLEEVVRRGKGNPITDMAQAFRMVVRGAAWPSLKPDGFHIQHLSVEDFEKAIETEFTRSDWHFLDSKILAWRNQTVIAYNQEINQLVNGTPEFQKDDYAICNSFISRNGVTIKADQTVCIKEVGNPTTDFDIPGRRVIISGTHFFLPDNPAIKTKIVNKLLEEKQYNAAKQVSDSWIDLRASYAQTVDKSQGSTYDKVFIDLDDIAQCNSGDRIARMLYVGFSRARSHVYLKGDLA